MWDRVNMQYQKVSKVPPFDGIQYRCELIWKILEITGNTWVHNQQCDYWFPGVRHPAIRSYSADSSLIVIDQLEAKILNLQKTIWETKIVVWKTQYLAVKFKGYTYKKYIKLWSKKWILLWSHKWIRLWSKKWITLCSHIWIILWSHELDCYNQNHFILYQMHCKS